MLACCDRPAPRRHVLLLSGVTKPEATAQRVSQTVPSLKVLTGSQVHFPTRGNMTIGAEREVAQNAVTLANASIPTLLMFGFNDIGSHSRNVDYFKSAGVPFTSALVYSPLGEIVKETNSLSPEEQAIVVSRFPLLFTGTPQKEAQSVGWLSRKELDSAIDQVSKRFGFGDADSVKNILLSFMPSTLGMIGQAKGVYIQSRMPYDIVLNGKPHQNAKALVESMDAVAVSQRTSQAQSLLPYSWPLPSCKACAGEKKRNSLCGNCFSEIQRRLVQNGNSLMRSIPTQGEQTIRLKLKGSNYISLSSVSSAWLKNIFAGMTLDLFNRQVYAINNSGWSVSASTNCAANPSLGTLGGGSLTYVTPPNIQDYKGYTTQLFVTGGTDTAPASWTDVNQGQLGNCWFMAALAGVARYGLANSLFTDASGTNGKYTLRFFAPSKDASGVTVLNQKVSVCVNNTLPVNTKGFLVFCVSDDMGELWPSIVEKAAAASFVQTSSTPGYPSLDGGLTSLGLSMLLGGYGLYITNQGQTAAQLFNDWFTLSKNGRMLSPSWKAGTSTSTGYSGEPLGNQGLVSGHAYTVLAVRSVQDDQLYQLAQIRNPWGAQAKSCTQSYGEWSGDWSDCSTLWSTHPNVAKAVGYDGARVDGIFWMSFVDIAKNLDSFEVFHPTDSTLWKVDLSVPVVSGTLTTAPVATTTAAATTAPATTAPTSTQYKFYGSSIGLASDGYNECLEAWCVPGASCTQAGAWTAIAQAGSAEGANMTYYGSSANSTTSTCIQRGFTSDGYDGYYNIGNFEVDVYYY